MSRVVVVGAGLGGLAAAARLAAQGHEVTVCEQAAQVGGKVGRLHRDGFGVDTGPSLVTMPQVFDDLFRATGDPVDLLERTTLPRARFTDGTVMAEATTAADFLAGLDRQQAEQWRDFMAHAGRVWQATHEPFLESPLHGARTLARLLVRHPRDLATVAPRRSLRQLGDQRLADPHLRQLLDRYATYSGSDPRRAPAALCVVPWVEQTYGAWRLAGGTLSLVEAVRDRALERGARLRTSCDVTAIERQGSRVSGVRLRGGGRLAADIVVANADAHHVSHDLLDDRRLRRRVAHAPLSHSGLVVCLGLRGTTPGLSAHEVLFPADRDAEHDQLARGHCATDPVVYVSTAGSVAPPGHEAWFTLVQAPRQGEVDWEAAADGEVQRVLHLLAQRGLDVTDRVLWAHVRTPADLGRETRSPGGALYGTSSDGARAAFLRPPNRTGVPGLFLVGGSSHPGGGLPLVALSGQIVAGLIGRA